MSKAATFEPGNFRYVPGPFQYSGGVAAEPGFAVERVRFARPVPLEDGFARIAAHITALGRPMTAFCACELRSPEPFTEEGFVTFNRVYVGTLERWGLMRGEDNPVARSNVCPELLGPAEPSFYAFSYTVPRATSGPSFVVAGSAEAPERGHYEEHIVRRGETTPDALAEKADFVLSQMEARMDILGVGWADATATQVYTVHDIHPFLAEKIVARGAASAGLTWHYARPPVRQLDYEMDLRGVATERVL